MFLKNKRMANRYLRVVVISGERGRGIEWKREHTRGFDLWVVSLFREGVWIHSRSDFSLC